MKKNNLNVLLLVLLMIAAIYIADGFIFKSIAVWLFYLLPVIIAAWNIPELLSYSMNMLSSLLILFDLYSNHTVFSKTEIFNRLIGIAVLWTVGIISVKFNRTKTKLEESEILLSSAQELAHLGSLKLNTRTKELFFTEESKRIFGFDPKPGSVDFDLAIECIHPEDRHLISESLDRNISGKQTEEIHYRLAFPDGSVKYIYSITKPIFDKKGEVSFVDGTMMDVTHQKLSLEELNQSNEKFSKIFELSPVAISISELETSKFVNVNNSFLKIFGYSKEEIIGHSAYELNLWSDISDRMKLKNELIEKSRVENFRSTYRKKSGELGDSLSFAEKIRLDGRDYILSLFLDITTQNRIEQELRSSELLFRQVWENSFDGMRLIDKKGIVVRVNEAFCRLVQLKREDIEGQPFSCIYGKFQEEKFRKGIERFATRTVVPFIQEEFILWNGKKSWFEVSNSILEFQNREPLLLSIFRDVSDRKAAEEELQNTVKKLESSNKNLEEFAYVASHDLQEPLRMVSNYTQLLSNRYSDKLDENAKEYMEFAVSGAKRMQELIKNLLDYSRVTTKGKAFEEVETEELLKTVIERMSMSISETNTVITYSSLPKVKADPIQIERLFQNLISNSIKFRSDKDPQIDISAEQKGREWIFSHKDNGIGIDQKYKDRIFVLFQRLHSSSDYPGTGIGLAVCKKIVERHGGRIWMESEKGTGTTFYFTLPKNEAK